MNLEYFYNQFFAKYYNGRIGRKNFIVFSVIILFLLKSILNVLTSNLPTVSLFFIFLQLTGNVIILYFLGGLITRRLHDLGQSGKLTFLVLIIYLIPYIDYFIGIYLYWGVFLLLSLIPGQKQDNIYGKTLSKPQN